MAVKMRLRREGKKKQPFYRVVVADVRSPRDGGYIEDIGFYQPLHDPSTISIDRERALHWLRNGVQPTDAVVNLLRIEGIWEDFKPGKGARSAAQEAARAARPVATADRGAPEPVAAAPAGVVAQAREESRQPEGRPERADASEEGGDR